MLSPEIDLTFEGKVIRIFDQHGDPWWALSDLCEPLEISNSRRVANRLDEDERCNLKVQRGGEITIVSEPGLYKVVARSKAAATPGTPAHRFLRWLTHEVLPSIRKHGQYPTPVIDIAALPAPEPIQPSLESTPSVRFFEECRRHFGTDSPADLEKLLKGVISKGRLVAMKADGGVLKALNYHDAWQSLTGIFDLHYILHGSRTQTGQERELIRQIRGLEPHQQAVALHQIGGQIELLRALPEPVNYA